MTRTIQLTLENSNTQFLELFDSSNKFFGPLNISNFFRQKNSRYLESRYLEYLGRSNKIVGTLDDFLSFSQTFVLKFRPKLESSNVLFDHITKVFSFSSDIFALFSSYGDEIRSLTLEIETFLNKEQTDFFQVIN